MPPSTGVYAEMLPHISMHVDFMPYAFMPHGQTKRMDSHMSSCPAPYQLETSALQVTTQWGDGCGNKSVREVATIAG
jgi:hypothetical protein